MIIQFSDLLSVKFLFHFSFSSSFLVNKIDCCDLVVNCRGSHIETLEWIKQNLCKWKKVSSLTYFLSWLVQDLVALALCFCVLILLVQALFLPKVIVLQVWFHKLQSAAKNAMGVGEEKGKLMCSLTWFNSIGDALPCLTLAVLFIPPAFHIKKQGCIAILSLRNSAVYHLCISYVFRSGMVGVIVWVLFLFAL